MTFCEQLLERVWLIKLAKHVDYRGEFVKSYNHDLFLENYLPFVPAESFVSTSRSGVLRGMHYQTGLASHTKLVTCLRGKALDVVVNIDPKSDFFNHPVCVELNDHTPYALLIGEGYAHGFLALEEHTMMMYHTSSVHNPQLDTGVLWSSIDFEWPLVSPILSERDKEHPKIQSLIH